MSTPLTDRIEALTAQANAVTGESDTTLTDAVGTLTAGFGKPELWKTVTLAEDHTSQSTGNPVYWRSFFDISEDDILNGYVYFCEVFGNSGYEEGTNYYVGNGVYFASGSIIFAAFARSKTSPVYLAMYRPDYYAYMSAGTTITIYRFKTA